MSDSDKEIKTYIVSYEKRGDSKWMHHMKVITDGDPETEARKSNPDIVRVIEVVEHEHDGEGGEA
jgi:hypothetical protein